MHSYGTENVIWVGFGPFGSTEKQNLGWIMSNLHISVKRLAESSNHQKSGKIPRVHCVITNCATMWQ